MAHSKVFFISSLFAMLMASWVSAGNENLPGYIPAVIRGKVKILDDSYQALPAIGNNPPGIRTFNHATIEPVLKNGRLVEEIIGGETFFKAEQNGVVFWVHADDESSIVNKPNCQALKKTSSAIRSDNNARYYNNNNEYLPGIHANTKLKLFSNPNCGFNQWVEACAEINGQWIPTWISSANVHSCQLSETEAQSQDIACADCGEINEVESVKQQAAEIQQIAGSQSHKTMGTYEHFVPDNIDEVANSVAEACRLFADYKVREMDSDLFQALIDRPGGKNSKKSDKQVNTCKQKLDECFGKNCSEDEFNICYGIAQKCNLKATSSGWCTRGVREILQKLKMIPGNVNIGVTPTPFPEDAISSGEKQRSNALTELKKYGFEDKFNEYKTPHPPYFDESRLPKGAVILYANPGTTARQVVMEKMGLTESRLRFSSANKLVEFNKAVNEEYLRQRRLPGHAEVFTGTQYASDFSSTEPISLKNSSVRRPIAILIQTNQDWKK